MINRLARLIFFEGEYHKTVTYIFADGGPLKLNGALLNQIPIDLDKTAFLTWFIFKRHSADTEVNALKLVMGL